MNIRQLILENELILLKNFPVYSRQIKAFMTKIERITYDLNVVDFCKSTFDNTRKKQQLLEYKKAGFHSCLDIIESNITLVDDKRFTTDDLVVGEVYNSYDISSLAMNFNHQRGMYKIPQKSSEYIVKAMIRRGVLAKIPYENTWIKENEILKYYFQSETKLSSENIIFSHKINKAIYNDFISNSYHLIHTFYRYDFDEYIYDGVYFVLEVDLNNKFMLIKKIDEYSSIQDNFLKTVLSTVSSRQNLKETFIDMIFSDEKNEVKKKTARTKKIDYEKQYSKNAEIGEIGEKHVLEFEKNRLINAGKAEYVERVRRVSLESDSYGYDILSFDYNDEGAFDEINIEVKTTANNQNTPFFMSQNELEHYNNFKSKTRIYRVYNVMSKVPLFYQISKNNIELFEMKPHIYYVKFKKE
ncbi:DUF3883 domain-containing protein [Paracholeplasma manati]|uniref:DUF3883 domain-containing protein n=1 Tax=Paracholeplasma manati TaxID=591373 RepID=UPI002407E5BE|nr:DUF3883 domain-containing protein [Paracholeplasma manati]MDG0889086.1 DUF3883 domain-containing protein [Paracholeplasma manati]